MTRGGGEVLTEKCGVRCLAAVFGGEVSREAAKGIALAALSGTALKLPIRIDLTSAAGAASP